MSEKEKRDTLDNVEERKEDEEESFLRQDDDDDEVKVEVAHVEPPKESLIQKLYEMGFCLHSTQPF